jgi:hypothetical protein
MAALSRQAAEMGYGHKIRLDFGKPLPASKLGILSLPLPAAVIEYMPDD